MYQLALVKMLHNVKTDRFHPIFYYESPLPGNNNAVLRYKSKGHHTTGFDNREKAIESANALIEQLNGYDDTVTIELNENDDLILDDNEIPADTQIRPSNIIFTPL